MNDGLKEVHPPKRRYFTAVGLFSLKMVADRHRRNAYHNKHWLRASTLMILNDLEPLK